MIAAQAIASPMQLFVIIASELQYLMPTESLMPLRVLLSAGPWHCSSGHRL